MRYGQADLEASPGDRLLDVILTSGFDHRHICGGRGFCTSCRVHIIRGGENLTPVNATERERLGALAGSLRLACQSCVWGPVRVEVPEPLSTRFSLDAADLDPD